MTHIFGQQQERPAPRMVEVCRSFAYKLNLQHHGGNSYESADFFSSRKMQCEEDYVNEVSEDLYQQCVSEVRETVKQFIAEMKARQTRERKTA